MDTATPLDQALITAVYQTVRYYNVFDQAVTATTVWRTLLAPEVLSGQHQVHEQRWRGQSAPRLARVVGSLQYLVADGRVATELGHYVVAGRQSLIAKRQRRFWLAQDKWKVTRRIVRWLAPVPYVRSLAMSGSLAIGNTKPSSDIDVLVIAARGHLWTARLLLLLVVQVLGVRRKYWDAEAPNKVCLNHYLADTALAIDPDIRNIYTAQLYHQLVPLSGLPIAYHFQDVNRGWLKQYVMVTHAPRLPSVHSIAVSPFGSAVQRWVEHILSEPLCAWVEQLAETVQRRSIARHTKPHQPGRVHLSATELAFHPYTKVPAILSRFAQEEGQTQLL